MKSYNVAVVKGGAFEASKYTLPTHPFELRSDPYIQHNFHCTTGPGTPGPGSGISK
jgi:hypothetical protein